MNDDDSIKPVTVANLVAHLQTFPPYLPVAFQRFSEACLLELDDLKVELAQPPRPDGWVHDARPDKPCQDYLIFPGN